MCVGPFAPKKPKPTMAATPAAAPEPPDPVAEPVDPGGVRREEDEAKFGATGPKLRVDRSVSSGGVGAGGTGIKM
jgi:hypothetical protein